MTRVLDFLKTSLESTRSRWVVIAVAILLVAPCLAAPFVLDDHIFELLSRQDPGIRGFHSRPFNLLTFTTGVPADNHALMDEGALLPWWAHEQHTNALFRPLSVLTHRLDLALWPHSAWAMHAHGLLWFGLLLFVVWKLYDRIGPGGWVSGLGLLMFAWDDVHGATVGWIANRNAVIAMTCVTACLLFHHLHRTERLPFARVAAVVSVALAMCAAESGVVAYAYLFAYAVCFDRERRGSALVSLWPYVLVALAWRVAYKHGGYGTFGSEVYLDPGKQPLFALAALFWNLPCLLASQFGPGIPFADLMLWSSGSSRMTTLVVAWLDVLLMALIAYAALRDKPACRFWGVGLVLAAIPLTTSASGDRLLLPVGLGASALTAEVVATLADALRQTGSTRFRSDPASRFGYQVALGLILLVNVVQAPLFLPFRAYAMGLMGRAADRAAAGIPTDPGIVNQTVVVVNAPVDVLVSYIQLARARTLTPRPRHLYWLATASSPFSVERIATNELRVTKELGYLYTFPERHYRASWFPFHRGDDVALSEMDVRIADVTADGRPSVVDFTFREPLESNRYLFLTWNGTDLVSYALPNVSGHTDFVAQSLFSVMFGGLSSDGPSPRLTGGLTPELDRASL